MSNGSQRSGNTATTTLIAIAVTVTMLVGTYPEYALGTVVPFMERGGPLNAQSVGVYTSLMFLSAGAVSIAMGKLVDFYPVIPLNVFLFLAVGIVMASLPLLRTDAHFVAFSLIAGVFLALSNPLTNRIIRANVAYLNRPWVVGWKSIGPQLGALVAGIVYALSGSAWREASYGSSAFFVALALIFGALLGRLLTHDRAAHTAAEPLLESAAESRLHARSVIGWLLVFSFFTSGAIATVGAYVPVFAHETLDFTPDMAALAAAVVALATIVGRAVWVGACRHFTAIRLLIVATLMAALSSLGLMIAPVVGEWVFWVSLIAVGLTALGMLPLVQVIVLEAADLSRIGRSSALVGVGTYGGFAVQPIVMLEVMKAVGFANSWGVLVVSNMIGAAVLLLYVWLHRRPGHFSDESPSEAATRS